MAEEQAKKILVVEDEPFLRDLYRDLLREEGYQVEAVEDGEQGFDKMVLGGYDLVLLDIMLPKIDGLTILQKLQKSPPRKPNGKIVLLTNLGQEGIIKEGFNLGASGYLIKSAMTPDQILSEVKNFLTKAE